MKSTRRALLLVAVSLGLGCSMADHSIAIESQVRALAPALELEFESSGAGKVVPGKFDVRRFSVGPKPPQTWPYGTGFAIADLESLKVLWIYLHNGDFPPHELRWADFDGDGREDIFFHAGFEDVATTHVYVNRISSASYAVSHFAQAYENNAVYAVVVDLDGDGRPELIVPDGYPAEDDECAESFGRVAGSNEEWKSEYGRIAGRFDEFNFQFGETAAAYDAFGLFTKPSIVAIGPKPASSAVVRHLRVRQQVIGTVRESLSPPCQIRAVEVTAYLEGLVDSQQLNE